MMWSKKLQISYPGVQLEFWWIHVNKWIQIPHWYILRYCMVLPHIVSFHFCHQMLVQFKMENSLIIFIAAHVHYWPKKRKQKNVIEIVSFSGGWAKKNWQIRIFMENGRCEKESDGVSPADRRRAREWWTRRTREVKCQIAKW